MWWLWRSRFIIGVCILEIDQAVAKHIRSIVDTREISIVTIYEIISNAQCRMCLINQRLNIGIGETRHHRFTR